MEDRERIPDESLVVRCGLPPFVDSPLVRGCRRHPDGPYGFSVQTAPGLTVEQLATACRNKSVGYTTVGTIREMGYDVVRTGHYFYHATVVVPEEWSTEAAEELTRLFLPAKNPAPKG
jgi:hypothetical protein